MKIKWKYILQQNIDQLSWTNSDKHAALAYSSSFLKIYAYPIMVKIGK